MDICPERFWGFNENFNVKSLKIFFEEGCYF
jgi:hypothetical protein